MVIKNYSVSNLENRKALLVYPEFPIDSFWNYRLLYEKIFPKNQYGFPKSGFPPLGLLCIANVISAAYGRKNVRLIDMNVQSLTDADYAWGDDVYLSAMLTQARSFDAVAEKAKALGKTTIAGGPYVSKKTPNVDHKFLNESENTLQPFLEDFVQGQAKAVYEGSRPDPSAFFKPDYSWIDMDHYTDMMLQFSRGCPHDCEFCDITVRYGRKMRTKDVDIFLEEAEHLYQTGWRGPVFIIDDNFIGKPKAALELLKSLVPWQKARNYPFSFYTQATVLLAEKPYQEILHILHPAGFCMVFFGIESPNEESLRETNKRHNLVAGSSLAEKLNKIRKEGQIHITGGFIVGFDSDKPDIFKIQEKFINEEVRIPAAMVALLEPLPETHLYDRLKKEGRLLRESKGDIGSGTQVKFRPIHFSPEELTAGYLQLLKGIYLDMKKYYARCSYSIQFMSPPPQSRSKRLHLGDRKVNDYIVARNLIILEGFKSRHKLLFWQFLLKVAIRYPRRLPDAFTFIAHGLHYRTLTERKLANSRE